MKTKKTRERDGGALTIKQASLAIALASQYGHEWAHWLRANSDEDAIALLASLDLSELARLVEGARSSYAIVGISAPHVDAFGHVVHVTGSGRLWWAIDRVGHVSLEIRRPDEAAQRVLDAAHAAGLEPLEAAVQREALRGGASYDSALAARAAHPPYPPRAPGVVVLRAVVRGDLLEVLRGESRVVGERHVDALAEALRALGYALPAGVLAWALPDAVVAALDVHASERDIARAMREHQARAIAAVRNELPPLPRSVEVRL